MMKLLLVLGFLAVASTGLMADKCEVNMPNTDQSTTPQ
jgi:hypothetical protein